MKKQNIKNDTNVVKDKVKTNRMDWVMRGAGKDDKFSLSSKSKDFVFSFF